MKRFEAFIKDENGNKKIISKNEENKENKEVCIMCGVSLEHLHAHF